VKKNPKDPPPHGVPLKEVEGILASEGEEVLEGEPCFFMESLWAEIDANV
jgi:hypothetical protein